MKRVSITVTLLNDGFAEYDAVFSPSLTPAERQRASDIVRRLLRDSLPYDARTSGIDVAPTGHDGVTL